MPWHVLNLPPEVTDFRKKKREGGKREKREDLCISMFMKEPSKCSVSLIQVAIPALACVCATEYRGPTAELRKQRRTFVLRMLDVLPLLVGSSLPRSLEIRGFGNCKVMSFIGQDLCTSHWHWCLSLVPLEEFAQHTLSPSNLSSGTLRARALTATRKKAVPESPRGRG